MKNSYIDGLITSKEEIAQDIYKMKLRANLEALPGQFFMLRAWSGVEPFLPRPISVSDMENGEITFLYQVKGRGTKLMKDLEVGEKIKILGPLGSGFNLDKGKKIALVGGGIGIAPLLYLAKELRADLDLYAGFRNEVYYIDELRTYLDTINIATENGSLGHKGYITEIIEPEKYDLIIACGPMNMIRELARISSGKVDLEISMENNMGCGIGACMGCTIETENGMKRVCKEGPVFKAEEVVI